MKRILYYCLMAICCMAAACSGGGNDPDEPIVSNELLDVSPSTVNISGTTGSFSISANCAWRITGAESWVNLSSTDGTGAATINVTCDKNNKPDESRSCYLQVSSKTGNVKRTVTIQQAPGDMQLSCKTRELTFTYDGGENKVEIESNTRWTMKASVDWIHSTPDNGTGNATITIKADANGTQSRREGVVTIKSANSSGQEISVEIKVSQEALVASLSISPREKSVIAQGEEFDINITTNTTWVCSSAVDWINIDKSQGTNDAKVHVKVSPNTTLSDREGIITIKNDASTETCVVKQTAGQLAVITNEEAHAQNRTSISGKASFTSMFDLEACGLCYDKTNSKPTVSQTYVTGTGSGKSGNISATITGLEPATRYYVRFFVRTAAGVAYSNTIEVSTAGSIPDPDDNPDIPL